MAISQSYKAISTEFYDCIKPSALEKEILFYTSLLTGIQGPFLEAMCGSGRLLVPLVQFGYEIDGVDNSSAMLQQCAQRLHNQQLTANLYDQDIQYLSINKQYAVIIVAYGSFQLLYPKDNALKALVSLKKHLQPGGLLVLDTFIPTDFIMSDTSNFYNRRLVKSGVETIELVSRSYLDRNKQTFTSLNRYTKKSLDKIAIEEEERTTTWYEDAELHFLLQQAGYTTITSQNISFQAGDKSLIYTAR